MIGILEMVSTLLIVVGQPHEFAALQHFAAALLDLANKLDADQAAIAAAVDANPVPPAPPIV